MKKRFRISSFQIIFMGFLLVILIGSVLLMLPFSNVNREVPNYLDSLFTATSAVCVTGLVVFDTGTYFSVFGKVIIIILIQIGGLGVIVVANILNIISRRKMSLHSRSLLVDSLPSHEIGNVVKFTRFIMISVAAIELTGALLMMPFFIKEFGGIGILYALFHSISAYCNAGFDLIGNFKSFTGYSSNITINIVIPLLIILGGLGFFVYDDFIKYKFHFEKYRVLSKISIVYTGILLALPFIYFLIFEFKSLDFGNKLMVSFFQSATLRTAGFNSIDLTVISKSGIVIMIMMMLIGGSSISTAGGMKTSTVATLIAATRASFRNNEDPVLFKRRIKRRTVNSAVAIAVMYLFLFLVGGISLSLIEGIDLLTCLFESASALGTVGLSLGITSTLSTASKIIIIFLMFLGRVGGLTLIYAAFGNNSDITKYPAEKMIVG